MKILVLRHVDCEPPAAYGPALERVAEVQTVRLGVDPLPSVDGFVAVVVMGGPMGVNDRESIGWIDDEIAFLRAALDRDIPVWGVCLGAQMLAAALDAPVVTGPVPEVGVGTVTLTADGAVDPVWGRLGPEFTVLQWHSDTFEIPAGATLLAGSKVYPNQLFRHGKSYGIQFHIEASHAVAQEWLEIPEYRESLEAAQGSGAAARFLTELRATESDITSNAGSVVSAWLRDVVGLEGSGS